LININIMIQRTFQLVFIMLVIMALSGCGRTDKAYWPDGGNKHEIPYLKGEIDGLARWWYENGNMEQTVEYRNGMLDGTTTRWYEHGILSARLTYKDNLKNGLSSEWDRSGKIILEETFRNDTLHGPTRRYHTNRKLKSEEYYDMGRYDGTWFYWNEYGVVVGEGIYEKGMGVFKEWNNAGVMVRRSHYRDNVKNGLEVWWDDQGNKINELYYTAGEIDEQR
jgi:antitoxin component YwqK of YwqJK toxin-antitoxin module